MSRSPRRRGSGEAVKNALSLLKKGEPSPLYLLYGEESFQREEVVREIRRSVLGEEGSDFNHDVFTWGETNSADIVAAAMTLPFMGGQRLVEVHSMGQPGDKDADTLELLISEPPPTAVVVFIAEKADMRRTFFKNLAGAGNALKMEPPSDREIPGWAQAQAQVLGFTLTREAAMLLAEWVEPSLGRIRAELEKLAAYLGPEKVAGEDAVRDLVGRSRVEAMYKLGDMLAAGDVAKSIVLARDLGQENAGPQFLVGFLRNQIRRWTIVKAASRGGMGKSELAEVLGVPPFAVERLQRQVAQASGRFFRELYGKLLAVDRRIKRSGSGSVALQAIEIFIIEMCSGRGGFGAERGYPAPGRSGAGGA